MSEDFYKFEPVLKPHLNKELNVTTGDFEIDNLNLTRVIAKAMDPTSGYAWPQHEAEEIAGLYRAFLYLCKRYTDHVVVPPREVDEFWHLHILDTRNYLVDCQRIFGSYLHHFPYAGLEGTALPQGKEEELKEKTLELVARHFPQLLENSYGPS